MPIKASTRGPVGDQWESVTRVNTTFLDDVQFSTKKVGYYRL